MSQQDDKKQDKKYPGYPAYPAKDDIYNREDEEDLDPENLNRKKPISKSKNGLNEDDFEDDLTGEDLDVPGAELDDDMEDIGSEDEENNYYSLGGDDHDDLEEDRD